MTMTKLIYRFGGRATEGGAQDIEVLGGKGAHLAEMARIGLPVPPGLTIAAEACASVFSGGRQVDGELFDQIAQGIEDLEIETGRRFGGDYRPLVLAVRSGARVSMPGMMDTILNVGLTDVSVEAIGRSVGDMRFAWDSYRRLIQMYGDVVMGIEIEAFEDVLDEKKARLGVREDADMTADDWRSVVEAYKELVLAETRQAFPQDAWVQLREAINSVYASWMNPRAAAYRRIHGIPEAWGTAVNIQTMVFGNRDNLSATGVVFTRNPSTGERELFGEFLINAQGEDVVAGIRTPMPLTDHARLGGRSSGTSMEGAMPEVFEELRNACGILETHYRDMQDVEFTVEQGKLWILQTRRAKRTDKASVKIAVDMANEGLISREEAVLRVDPEVLARTPHPMVDPEARIPALGAGLPASPGAATGEIVFHPQEAVEAVKRGRRVILVRIETSPEDIEGMHVADGVLTTRGGMTSHAAVVARGIGKPCVVGAASMRIDLRNGHLIADGATFSAGDVITIDGSTGRVFAGKAPTISPKIAQDFTTLGDWSDDLALRGRIPLDDEETQDGHSPPPWKP
jgi:pyruvate,orthophosphate dikinase